MELKILLIFGLILQASCEEPDNSATATKKEKRQNDEIGTSHYVYRNARKQEQVAPVEEPQEDEKSRGPDEYRPGQVISLNVQELLDLQPERKAPLPSNQQLQQIYSNPQPEHKQNLQPFYYVDPQASRQVSLHPSHAVITRPHFSANGGEASVGAALAVSDSGANTPEIYDQDLFALLGHSARQDDRQRQSYTQTEAPQVVSTVAPQYQQIDQYVTKPSKKPTKLRPKIHYNQPQSTTSQQYLIETTNVQPQYRPAPQNQRVAQTIRYVQAQTVPQQQLYERPESQGLKVIPAPKLQNLAPTYRVAPQYQQIQQEATPKQYRVIDIPRPQIRQDQPRVIQERPITYLKRFPEPEKVREQQNYQEITPAQRPYQLNDQYYLRPIYRTNEGRRYETPQFPLKEQRIESTKAPLSAIYVSKNIAPKKAYRPVVRIDPQASNQQSQVNAYRDVPYRIEQSNVQQVSSEQPRQSLEEQRVQLPPPKNNKAYTPEEFEALLSAGYSVTPIPVGQVGTQNIEQQVQPQQQAQSRSFAEPQYYRRPLYTRRHQYLPLRGDEAP
ncbi:uncharacterized protein LOC126975912 [Leptidea sinapis]|uniref:uncharacterized protein LOC126975912 n=1 Tax=Leptidea sinapis TaxID=189913 RepID=UPI00213489C2|nr:uncharacterized protein LOC126975912 [Leptidea sinapis]